MTIDQVQRLFFGANSYEYAARILAKLSKEGYLLNPPLFLDRETRYGKPKLVYSLSNNGYKYMGDLGIAIDPTYHLTPSDKASRRSPFLRHTLAVNEVFITAELLTHQEPAVSIRRMIHDFVLKRTIRSEYAKIPIRQGNRFLRVAVIPDGYIELVLLDKNGTQYMFPIVLEIDRATERYPQIQRKISGLLAWYETQFREMFAVPEMITAVVTTGNVGRLQDLTRCAEEELKQVNKINDADRFFFTNASPITTTPHDFFFSNIWYMPFERNPLALIDLAEIA